MSAIVGRRVSQTTLGVACATAAYVLWGLFPVYFKAVAAVSALQVLAHRVVWSVVVMTAVLTVLRRWPAVRRALARPRQIATLALSAACLSTNWGVFIVAVADQHVLQASLGYFINPLVSVLLGVFVLRERLRAMQWLAVGIAGCGVMIELLAIGRPPWIALTLAISFALYGLLRKVAAVDAFSGLFVETLLLLLPAAGYLGFVALRGESAFAIGDLSMDLLLMLAGPLTSLPLVLFVAGAQRIRLATTGVLQYLAPTGHFLLAVFLYQEPLSPTALGVFGCTWIALATYTIDALRHMSPPQQLGDGTP
jgi:chloramphenicol-sensitive protein RarD